MRSSALFTPPRPNWNSSRSPDFAHHADELAVDFLEHLFGEGLLFGIERRRNPNAALLDALAASLASDSFISVGPISACRAS